MHFAVEHPGRQKSDKDMDVAALLRGKESLISVNPIIVSNTERIDVPEYHIGANIGMEQWIRNRSYLTYFPNYDEHVIKYIEAYLTINTGHGLATGVTPETCFTRT